MTRTQDAVLLEPGRSISFENRDELLGGLDRLDSPGLAAGEGGRLYREQYQMVRYLQFLAGSNLVEPPVVLSKPHRQDEPQDFVLHHADGSDESFELTEGTTQEYKKNLSRTGLNEPVPREEISVRRRDAPEYWANVLFQAFLKKALQLENGRYDLDHLLISDGTAISYLVPPTDGGRLLRMRIEDWYSSKRPSHRFGRISVLADRALLHDLCGEGRILKAESPYFRLPVIRAADDDDLRRRLRDLDRYCRDNSIRHLKAFGSILGDLDKDFREDSDLDLLVEFEPEARVTLLDMARMERELSELVGFRVDLRTAGDLSRYFRQKVLDDAVELRATGS